MKSFNIPLFIATFLLIIATAGTAIMRLDMDTDVVRSLPSDSMVVSDALDIFANHPIHDQIAMDIALSKNDPDILVECGQFVEKRLTASGLFKEVGNSEIADLIPDLALYVSTHLPLLFSAAELEKEIAPRLTNSFIRQRLQESLQKLSSLEGIGQGRFVAADPLGFMEPVMAKMSMLAPMQDATFYKGFLLTSDREHLLVTARPYASGTDTGSAKHLVTLLDSIARDLSQKYAAEGIDVYLTPVGAYRASLDNERIIRHDVNLAILLSMLGIGLLLFIAFPRPLIGLLSLVPALFGTAFSLLLFSLFHSSISIMVLGFGAAIISITVDHGIAYLLFLDRPQKTKGTEASHEVRSIGLLAVLTTCGAFLTLNICGFPIFVQLGQFTAMGVLFSFLFVHFIFPYLIPVLPASTRKNLPLQRIVDAMYSTGRPGALAAMVLACILVFFARPDFQVDLASMNTVSQETLDAESLFSSVWGNINSSVVVMLSADSSEGLQDENDRLLPRFTKDEEAGRIQHTFNSSMLFPGTQLAQDNLNAWKEFFDAEKVQSLRNALQYNGEQIGFSAQAYKAFLTLFDKTFTPEQSHLPEKFYALLGITEKDGKLNQFVNVKPGRNWDSQKFYEEYHTNGKIFDSPYFSAQLAEILFNSFITMFAIIAGSIVIFLLFFFASWQLTLITLLPPLFAYVCTLGTMKWIGHPLDIPGLMLSIVILGMGIDYSIFFVRAHQRYRNPECQSFGLVRMAVFMAGGSTLIGFGVLCFAEHSILNSIGITSLLGIGYSLLGSFLLLPPLLNYYFSTSNKKVKEETDISHSVRDRYRLMEAYPRIFARFKLQYDPLFEDLSGLLAQRKDKIRKILDIGCGYGVPGCYCLEYCKNAKLIAFDPDPERVRVATLAAGNRGEVTTAMAPQLPATGAGADLALILDMLHYLNDDSVVDLFTNCAQTLAGGGQLLIRYVIRPQQTPSFSWKLEDFRACSSGSAAHYRSIEEMAELIEKSGFTVLSNSISTANVELVWLLGEVRGK